MEGGELNSSQILFFLFLLTGTLLPLSSQEDRSDFTLSILQDNREILPDAGNYPLQDRPFQIDIEGVSPEVAVAIFAYPTDEMFHRYIYPVSTSDTVMFAPATGLAMYENKDRAYYLSLNREGTHNYMSPDRRINRQNGATLNILGFQTIEGRQEHPRKVYLSLFIDSNQDRIIESHEIRHITLQWDQPGKKKSRTTQTQAKKVPQESISH